MGCSQLCAVPPFSQPTGPFVALPADCPRYVIPCSNLLDPAYRTQLNPSFPYPRQPLAYESETRAPGTGLLFGGPTVVPFPTPVPCPPCPPPINPMVPGTTPLTPAMRAAGARWRR